MRLEVAGGIESALTHMAMIGVASILEEAGASYVRTYWQEGPAARAVVVWEGEPLGSVVHAHARRHSRTDSWVQATLDHEGRQTAVFSPRIKAASSLKSWQVLTERRAEVLDGPLSMLDRRMIGALGEPAFWLVTDKDVQPDRGASRWEMQVRERGDEFIGQRLAPLAFSVAARSPATIEAGIRGLQNVDELGKQGVASRTPTGLQPRGATDNALAWCALWGISATTLVPQARDMSQTAGVHRRTVTHPVVACLPVLDRPTTRAVWAGLFGSRMFDAVVRAQGQEMREDDVDLIVQFEARDWLQSRGVAGVVVFPVSTSTNASAPERIVQLGRFVPFRKPSEQ